MKRINDQLNGAINNDNEYICFAANNDIKVPAIVTIGKDINREVVILTERGSLEYNYKCVRGMMDTIAQAHYNGEEVEITVTNEELQRLIYINSKFM